MTGFSDRFKLTDKVAILTGAGKGIGKGTAVALAESGAHVVCAARTAADIEETARLVRATGRRALAVPCDVTVTADLERLVEATLAEFGRIDILVNNAGGWNPIPALNVSEEEFEYTLRFNLTSIFLLSKMVAPVMGKTGGGAIVNISSGASYMSLKAFAPYGAAKAGLNQLTNILAAEFAPKVRVNGIVVGAVLTEGMRASAGEERCKQAGAKIPMKRMGDPSDIAAGVVYLASPAAQWVTGTMLHINGGAISPSAGGDMPVPEL